MHLLIQTKGLMDKEGGWHRGDELEPGTGPASPENYNLPGGGDSSGKPCCQLPCNSGLH